MTTKSIALVSIGVLVLFLAYTLGQLDLRTIVTAMGASAFGAAVRG